MKVKEEREKAGLKLNNQKTKIMAFGPITSWQIDGEAMETATDFIFWGSKITAVGGCSHETKRCLLLGRKAMTNLDIILKSRDITLLTNVHLVKPMNKASRGDGIPVELFQILKDDAVKVLHSICQQIWKTQQWPQGWKRSVFILIPKKGNAKACSNYHTIALISHASNC